MNNKLYTKLQTNIFPFSVSAVEKEKHKQLARKCHAISAIRKESVLITVEVNEVK
jgi:hypothetical protein